MESSVGFHAGIRRWPVPSPDGKTVFVCNRFNNDVSAVDLQTLRKSGALVLSGSHSARTFHLMVNSSLPIGCQRAGPMRTTSQGW